VDGLFNLQEYVLWIMFVVWGRFAITAQVEIKTVPALKSDPLHSFSAPIAKDASMQDRISWLHFGMSWMMDRHKGVIGMLG